MDIEFNGLDLGLSNLSRLSNAETRSISAENFTGEKGKGGMATEGTGAPTRANSARAGRSLPACISSRRKRSQSRKLMARVTIQHMWMTVRPDYWRCLILRIYWDGEESPSVEVPLGDFFCNGWCQRCNVNSLPISVNPAGGFNSYWEMPFRKSVRITLESHLPQVIRSFYYQIDYALTDIPEDRAYFHAQWRRSNPLGYGEVHTLLDGIHGMGHLCRHLHSP